MPFELPRYNIWEIGIIHIFPYIFWKTYVEKRIAYVFSSLQSEQYLWKAHFLYCQVERKNFAINIGKAFFQVERKNFAINIGKASFQVERKNFAINIGKASFRVERKNFAINIGKASFQVERKNFAINIGKASFQILKNRRIPENIILFLLFCRMLLSIFISIISLGA